MYFLSVTWEIKTADLRCFVWKPCAIYIPGAQSMRWLVITPYLPHSLSPTLLLYSPTLSPRLSHPRPDTPSLVSLRGKNVLKKSRKLYGLTLCSNSLNVFFLQLPRLCTPHIQLFVRSLSRLVNFKHKSNTAHYWIPLSICFKHSGGWIMLSVCLWSLRTEEFFQAKKPHMEWS